jgi:glycosyltransferase involved in cell wall biosynthesis
VTNISVVTPAYVTNEQEAAWLDECIESVATQSRACEHIVWSDASPADLSALKRKYPHVVWRGWEERRGACWTRNAAVATARGPLILPIDADDKVEPNTAESFYAAWEREGPHCFIYGNIRLFGAGMEHDRTLPDYDFGLTLKTCLAPVTILYPKQAWAEIGGYDPEFESGMEDWVFLIALGVKGYCGVRVDGTFLWYRSRPGSRRVMMRGRNHEIVGRVQEKFAPIYRGERPPECCKGDGQVHVPSVVRESKKPPLPKDAPRPVMNTEVLLRYVGEKQGNFSIRVRPTRRFITVSARNPDINVKPEEADWILKYRRDFMRRQ